jgi:hypothetical protein
MGDAVDVEQEVGSTEQIVGGWINPILVGGHHSPIQLVGSRPQLYVGSRWARLGRGGTP